MTTLDDLKQVLNPKPLRPDELDGLFVETGDARDPELSRREVIAETLAEGPGAKVLLAGHGGTGKSTELVKFCSEYQEHFTFVQLSIVRDGDPANVNVEDLLVLIAEAVLRQMGERGIKLDEDNLKRIHAWFDETFKIREENLAFSGEVGGGIATQDSLLGKLLGPARQRDRRPSLRTKVVSRISPPTVGSSSKRLRLPPSSVTRHTSFWLSKISTRSTLGRRTGCSSTIRRRWPGYLCVPCSPHPSSSSAIPGP